MFRDKFSDFIVIRLQFVSEGKKVDYWNRNKKIDKEIWTQQR